MKSEIKYIELKSGGENGPAWIGLVSYSQSGRTIFFNGKAFQKIGSDRIRGSFFDTETMEEYWISGVKKDLTDRLEPGKGKIVVEERILDRYLKLVNLEKLDLSRFEIGSVIEEISVERISELESEKTQPSNINNNKRFSAPHELSDSELEYFISSYEASSIKGQHLKNRKLARKKMNELIAEREKRQAKAN